MQTKDIHHPTKHNLLLSPFFLCHEIIAKILLNTMIKLQMLTNQIKNKQKFVCKLFQRVLNERFPLTLAWFSKYLLNRLYKICGEIIQY